MSNTIAHLVVANRILSRNPKIARNLDAYYLGAIAPDTIGSKKDCTRNDKKLAHLREGIADAEWLDDDKMAVFNERIDRFVATYICDEAIRENQKDFNIGYLVHLLTDKWNHKTVRQLLLKIANANGVRECDKEFFHMCVNDLEALDGYLLEKYPEIGSLFLSLGDKTLYSLSGYIEKEYIAKSIHWWREEYLPRIKTRELKYISSCDIDIFVDFACDNILRELEEYKSAPCS